MRDELSPELTAALQPVLRDLETVELRPRITPTASGLAQVSMAVTWWPDGSGAGVRIDVYDDPADRIAMIADQIQDAAVEILPGLGRPAVWPECPDHPNSHPLRPGRGSSVAVWACPRTGREVARIGDLAATH